MHWEIFDRFAHNLFLSTTDRHYSSVTELGILYLQITLHFELKLQSSPLAVLLDMIN